MSVTQGEMPIGLVAKQLEISTRTIRYYEEIGLMGNHNREAGTVRSYSEKEIIRLKFILKLKELGITLREMKKISVNYELNNYATDKILPQLIEILDQHLRNIDTKIKNLLSLRREIENYNVRITQLLQEPSLTIF